MNIDVFKKIVEDEFNIKDISSPLKKGMYPQARAVFYKLCLDINGKDWSKLYIGEHVGRDHSVVIHSEKMWGRYRKNKFVKKAYESSYLRIMSVVEKSSKIEDIILFKNNESKALRIELDHINEKHMNIIEDMIIDHDNKIHDLNIKIGKLINENRISGLLHDLTDSELKEIEQRLIPIVKMMKMRKTYENTPKSSFNAKPNKLQING